MLGRGAWKCLGSITSRCLGYEPGLLKQKKLDLFSGKNKSGAERTREIESNKCPAWKGLINSKIDLF